MIQAIETIYNGYRFRSRLEARWAVFFDTLGIQYDYEPETYRLRDGTQYLPDFWVSRWEAWVEIKPIIDTVNVRKLGLLVQESHKSGLLCAGLPELISFAEENRGILIRAFEGYPCPCGCGRDVAWHREFRFCDWHGDGVYISPLYDDPTASPETRAQFAARLASPPLLAAYDAAKQARFEWGEQGAPKRRPRNPRGTRN